MWKAWVNSGLTSHQQIGHTETDLILKSYPRTGKNKESGLRPFDWYSSASSTLHSDRKNTEQKMGNNIKGRIGMDTANEKQREIKVNP